MSQNYSDLGRRIAVLRKEKGYTQETIVDCNSAGVPYRHAVNCILARKIEA